MNEEPCLYQRCRIYLADVGDGLIEGYTLKRSINDVMGISSKNMHVHIGTEWLKNHAGEDFTPLIINLACNAKPPLVTYGIFNRQWSQMLDVIQILSLKP